MPERDNSLLFPLAFWNGSVPTHSVCCVLRRKGYAITGSLTGELCLWNYADVGDDDDVNTGQVRGFAYFITTLSSLYLGLV